MSTQNACPLPQEKEDYTYGKNYSYYVLALLTTLYAFDFVDRSVISSLFGSLRAEWGLNDKQVGLLIATVNLAVAFFAFPTAILVDRWSRKNMVGLMGIVWCVATFACAFTGNYIQLLIMRFLVGAGEGGYGPGASSILQRYFPQRKINSVLGILHSGSMFGSVIGMIAGGIIVQYWGWRHAFGVVAIPGFFLAIMVFFIKEPARVAMTRVSQVSGLEEKISFGTQVKKLLSTRTIVFIYAAQAMALLFSICLTNWMPMYFARVDGLGPQDAAFKGSSILMAKGLGVIISGIICDRVARKIPNGHLLCATLFMVLMSAGYVYGFLFAPHDYAYAFLLGSGFLAAAMLAPASVTIMQASHKGLHATAIGLMIVVQNVFGMGLGATVSGVLSDFFKKMFVNGTLTINEQIMAANNGNFDAAATAMGLKTAMGTMSLSPLLAAFFFYMASRYYCRDCARVNEF